MQSTLQSRNVKLLATNFSTEDTITGWEPTVRESGSLESGSELRATDFGSGDPLMELGAYGHGVWESVVSVYQFWSLGPTHWTGSLQLTVLGYRLWESTVKEPTVWGYRFGVWGFTHWRNSTG